MSNFEDSKEALLIEEWPTLDNEEDSKEAEPKMKEYKISFRATLSQKEVDVMSRYLFDAIRQELEIIEVEALEIEED